MKRRLFLTGEIGAGKSTAIAAATADHLSAFGGFLTRRNRDAAGRVCSFSLLPADGSTEQVFLDVSADRPRLYPEVFDTLGVQALQGQALILDEIGGIDLLCPRFMAALTAALDRDTPMLGVLKGPSAARALAETLGLAEDYQAAVSRLWDRLSQDENTMIYTCAQYDAQAPELARTWAAMYAPEAERRQHAAD